MEEQRILASITQRQLKFFGHIIRENNLERLVLEGKIDGSRSKGRQRKKYLGPAHMGWASPLSCASSLRWDVSQLSFI